MMYNKKYLNKYLKNLKNNVFRNNRGYKKHIHYKYFTFKKVDGVHNNKSKNYKTLYFTYKGLIRCLYVSNSSQAENFQDWTNKILFTHQFGNKEEKQQLASNLIGVDINTMKEVFNTNATTISCVYLFALGTAKELRKSMNIDDQYSDDHVICKFGFTRRVIEIL